VASDAGTYEKIEDEEEEVYETVNLHKLKQYTPNLKVINLWGVAFITDEHVDSLSANCAFLECMCVNYCHKVRVGVSLSESGCGQCGQLSAKQPFLGDGHVDQESGVSMQTLVDTIVCTRQTRLEGHG
jgi:hypothetical protein